MPEPSNISPAFARDADRYLHEANMQRALELCLEGTTAFPTYSTGFLMLGKCYEAIGRTVESLMAYRQALTLLPDNATLQSLVQRAEEKEHQEFQRFSDEQRKRLEAQKAPPPQEEKSEVPTEESTIEYLAKKLQDVKRIQPKADSGDGGSARSPEQHNNLSAKFATVTIAEIYAGQGEYTEAIAAYRELIRQHPDHTTKYQKRIDEIEQLLDMQQSDKTLKAPPNKTAS